MEFQELADILPRPTVEWDNDDVVAFLEVMSLHAVIPKFRALKIEGKDFSSLGRQFVTNQLQVSSLAYTKKIIEWLEYGREEFDNYLHEYIQEITCKHVKKPIEEGMEDDQSYSKKSVDNSNQKSKSRIKDKENQRERGNQKEHQKSKYNTGGVKFIESSFFLAEKVSHKLLSNTMLIVTVDKAEHSVTNTLKLGRAPENDVVMPHDSVSRLHAIITKQALGEYTIKDMSRFGTYVKMDQKQLVLEEQIEILIGATNIFVKIDKVGRLGFDIRVEVPEQKINTFFQNRLSLMIGRKSKDIKIEDATISNQHLNIFTLDDRLIFESLEGVCYRRITHGEQFKIRDEDVFRMATTLVYCRFMQFEDEIEQGREGDFPV